MESPSAVKISTQSTDIPIVENFALAAFLLFVNLFALLIMPLFLLPASPWWAVSLVPLVALHNLYWSLIHETIHDLFHPSRRVNQFVGRLLSIFFASPFRVLRLSHLLHHKLNRSPMEATEVYDADLSSKWRVGFGYFFQILGGLYLVELLSAWLFLLPRDWLRGIQRRYLKEESVSGILMTNWLRDESLREIRRDGAMIAALLALSAFLYGAYWPLLIIFLGTRAFLISFLDNVYHYRTPVDEVFYATNLRLPSALAGALLYFNLHGVHHRNTAIPWMRLPVVFRSEGRAYDDGFFRAALRQLSGPVASSDLTSSRGS